MSDIELYTQISALPNSLKNEVKKFVELLKRRRSSQKAIKERKFGCAKGKIEMQDDFDEPLDDFKDYI